MPESLDAQLRTAIANRRLVQFRYDGKLRVAEPHDYGVQNGGEKLLVFQLRASGGPPARASASSKGVQGWRMLDVPKIAECAVLDETFAGSRGQSHQRHHAWDEVYARVALPLTPAR
jgi:hypothetical protein